MRRCSIFSAAAIKILLLIIIFFFTQLLLENVQRVTSIAQHAAHLHVTNIKEEKYTASVAVVGSRLPYTVAKLH